MPSSQERISGGFMDDLKKIGNGALEIVIWLLVHIPSLALWALIIALFIIWIRWCQKSGRKKAEKKAAGENTTGKGDNAHV